MQNISRSKSFGKFVLIVNAVSKFQKKKVYETNYRKVVSSNSFRLEAHAGIYRLLPYEGDFRCLCMYYS